MSCDLVSDGSFACRCGLGFESNQCETCADGFFGVPTEVCLINFRVLVDRGPYSWREMVGTRLFGRDDWDRVLGRHGLDPVPWEAWLGPSYLGGMVWTQFLGRHGLHPVLGDRRLILSHMSWYVTVNFFDKASFPVCITCLTCFIIWYEFQIKNS